jgi:signal transduction histidine kinase
VRGWRYRGVALVTALTILGVFGPARSVVVSTFVGSLSTGLFVAAAVLALFSFRDRRDPTLLLVGVGAAAYILHTLALLLLLTFTTPDPDGGLVRVLGFSPVAGSLMLAGCLLLVVPWRDRRGRPALSPTRVVVAVVAALFGIDVATSMFGPVSATVAGAALEGIEPLGWLALGAIALGGIVAMVRSLGWGGRFGWIASASLSLVVFAAAIMLSTTADSERALLHGNLAVEISPALTAGSLVVFVLASLQLESSRMRRASDRAEEVLTGRAEIAAMVAHDVRGPLGTMKGLATTIRKSYEQLGDEERLEFIGMIERESARLLAQVDHIALALRVDAQTLDLQLRRQPLGPLVRQAVEAVDHPPHPMDVDVPDAIAARVDAKWLPVAIGEGVANAARYSAPEAPIHVTLRVTDTDAFVEIADGGPGIPAERRDEVFGRFARWRPPGYEDRPGSGLGLFICRGIARAHGGDASLADGPAGGTILRIRLPLEGTGSE